MQIVSLATVNCFSKTRGQQASSKERWTRASRNCVTRSSSSTAPGGRSRWMVWERSRPASIDLEGVFSISFRPDTAFARGLNVPGIFTGPIANRGNIGKTTDELVMMWNESNPNDIVLPSMGPQA